MKLIVIAAVVTSIGAGAWMLWWRLYSANTGDKSTAPDSLSADVKNLRAQVRQLRNQQLRTSTQVVHYPVEHNEQAPHNESESDDSPEYETQEERWQRVEDYAQAIGDSLDGRLLSEVRDVAWETNR